MPSMKRMNRRQFMQRTSLVSVSAPALFHMSEGSLAPSSKQEIRAAMIGTGNRGRRVLEAVMKVEGVQVAALCDIDPEALEEALLIVRSHDPKTYSYHKNLLEQEDLDAVFVETPNYLHKAHTTDVLESGRHCSTAKPMALTVDEVNDLHRLAQKASGILHVDQQLRQRPQYLEVMRRIHRGDFGEVGFVRAQRDGRWDGKSKKERLGPRRWRYDIERSGDIILEVHLHNLDVMNWIMNDHPIRAAALGGQNLFKGEGEFLDNYGVTFEYPGDRHAVFSNISYGVPEIGGTFIHAYASEACADVSYDGPVKIYWRDRRTTEPTEIDAEVPSDDPAMNLYSVQDFFRSIWENKQPSANVEVGRTAVLTGLLARKAIYEKGTVTWDDLLREGAPTQCHSTDIT